jgi:hypothetical protein
MYLSIPSLKQSLLYISIVRQLCPSLVSECNHVRLEVSITYSDVNLVRLESALVDIHVFATVPFFEATVLLHNVTDCILTLRHLERELGIATSQADRVRDH